MRDTVGWRKKILIKLIAIVGKSGSGKDYFKNYLGTYCPQANLITPCTTRPRRDNEVYGQDYNFIYEDEFNNREFIEVTEFRGWYYGTTKDSLKEGLNIGVFNPDSLDQLRKCKLIDKLVIFYLKTNEIDRILRILNREERINGKEVVRRYYADEALFQKLEEAPDVFVVTHNYDNGYLVENFWTKVQNML